MRSDKIGLTATDADPSLFDLAAMEVAAPSAVTPYPDAPSPALANFLGPKPYWGRFTYSEDQMKLMGVRRGNVITGMQLRLADGISVQPQLPIRFNRMQIGLATGGSADVSEPASRFGATVFNRSLSIARCS